MDRVAVVLWWALAAAALTGTLLVLWISRQRARRQAEALAFEDPVTGGDSAAKFALLCRHLVFRAPPGSYVLVSLHIDDFDLIDEFLGSLQGDRVLRQLYDCLHAQLEPGELCARAAGEHFQLLLHWRGMGALRARLARAAIRLGSGTSSWHPPWPLSLSAGAYPLGDLRCGVVTAQDRATAACRAAAKLPRTADSCRCALYAPQDLAQALARKQKLDRAAAALAAGEFRVYLQPKADLQTGKICGAEALVRWQLGEKLLPPSDFIELFERSGFIAQLDRWVFCRVCALLCSWRQNGWPLLPISVNLSRRQLTEPDFLQPYLQMLQRSGLPPSCTQIELTETAAQDMDALCRAAAAIRQAGLGLAIDDFGAGYSSLASLRRLPADTLKLDRAFFVGGDHRRGEQVAHWAVQLAAQLGMSTVAEGVDTAAQARKLRGWGCTELQSYLLSPPVPPPVFEQMAFTAPRKLVL